MPTTNPPDPPDRGRRAEARRNDAALLDAARLVVAAAGPEAPVAAVADRAGVGIATLYRRYPTKDDLLRHLCRTALEDELAAAGAALAAADPWDALAGFVRACVAARTGVAAEVAAAVPVDPALTALAQRAHEALATLVSRAHRVGALRPDIGVVDLHELVELFGRRRPDDETAHPRLLALALDGLRAGPRGSARHPLPGSPPTWESYAARWLRR